MEHRTGLEARLPLDRPWGAAELWARGCRTFSPSRRSSTTGAWQTCGELPPRSPTMDARGDAAGPGGEPGSEDLMTTIVDFRKVVKMLSRAEARISGQLARIAAERTRRAARRAGKAPSRSAGGKRRDFGPGDDAGARRDRQDGDQVQGDVGHRGGAALPVRQASRRQRRTPSLRSRSRRPSRSSKGAATTARRRRRQRPRLHDGDDEASGRRRRAGGEGRDACLDGSPAGNAWRRTILAREACSGARRRRRRTRRRRSAVDCASASATRRRPTHEQRHHRAPLF